MRVRLSHPNPSWRERVSGAAPHLLPSSGFGEQHLAETPMKSAFLRARRGVLNTCIYWWSLRQNGIDDKIEGFGSLLLEH
jgi:hypothetical protein